MGCAASTKVVAVEEEESTKSVFTMIMPKATPNTEECMVYECHSVVPNQQLLSKNSSKKLKCSGFLGQSDNSIVSLRDQTNTSLHDIFEEDIIVDPQTTKSPTDRKRRIRDFSIALEQFLDESVMGTMKASQDLKRNQLRKIFDKLDRQKKNCVPYFEVKTAFQEMGCSNDDEFLLKLFRLSDTGETVGWVSFCRAFCGLNNFSSLQSADKLCRSNNSRSVLNTNRAPRNYQLLNHQAFPRRIKCLSMPLGDGPVFVACDRERPAPRGYNTITGEFVNMYHSSFSAGDVVMCMSMSPNRQLVAVGTKGKKLVIWDLITGVQITEIMLGGSVMCCVFESDLRIAVGGRDNIVRIFDIHSGAEILKSKPLGKGLGVVLSICFIAQPINKFVVSSTSDLVPKVLRAGTLATSFSLQGHSSIVWSVVVSPNLTMVASSCERYIAVWNVKSEFNIMRSFDVLTYASSDSVEQTKLSWLGITFCPSIFSRHIAASTSVFSIQLLCIDTGSTILEISTRANVFALTSGFYDRLLWGDEAGNIQQAVLS
eukprot:Sspe_Gene.83773::Locus_54955_Transcript_1_1_Confidence_1.000_Length_1733::g.83773::m.83773